MKLDYITPLIITGWALIILAWIWMDMNDCPDPCPEQPIGHTITYQEDSLCRVWVDSTHIRIAFKDYYKRIYLER